MRQGDLNKIVILVFGAELLCDRWRKKSATAIDDSFGERNKRLADGRRGEPEIKLNIKNSSRHNYCAYFLDGDNLHGRKIIARLSENKNDKSGGWGT